MSKKKQKKKQQTETANETTTPCLSVLIYTNTNPTGITSNDSCFLYVLRNKKDIIATKQR